MIISIRGANGAGKSTLVRWIMEDFTKNGGTITTMKYPPEKKKIKPCGYICRTADQTKALFVVGHYEIANGGLDTIPSLAYAYELALNHHTMGFDVIMEGKNFTETPTWITDLHMQKLDVRVAMIDIPVKECVESVRARGHKIKEETIKSLHAKSLRQFEIFKHAGVRIFKGDREQCLEEVRKWLK